MVLNDTSCDSSLANGIHQDMAALKPLGAAPHLSFAPGPEQCNSCNGPGQAGNSVAQCFVGPSYEHNPTFTRNRACKPGSNNYLICESNVQPKWCIKAPGALLNLDQREVHWFAPPRPFQLEKVLTSSTVKQSVSHSLLALYQRTLAVKRFKTTPPLHCVKLFGRYLSFSETTFNMFHTVRWTT